MRALQFQLLSSLAIRHYLDTWTPVRVGMEAI
jgi:hypothetical protein